MIASVLYNLLPPPPKSSLQNKNLESSESGPQCVWPFYALNLFLSLVISTKSPPTSSLPPPHFHHLKLAFKKFLVTSKNGPQCARPFYVLYFFEFGNPNSPLSPSLLLRHAL